MKVIAKLLKIYPSFSRMESFSTMKAFHFDLFGGSEVIKVKQFEIPQRLF